MNKLLFGTAMGMMAGVALMMSPTGRDIRRNVNRGMCKAKKMAKNMM